MEYIYFCPKCKAAFRYGDQSPRPCPDCNCNTVFSGYNASDWYAKPNKEREREKLEIIEGGALNRDVGDPALIDSFKETDAVHFKTDSSSNNYISYDKNTNLVNINGRYLLKDRIFGFDLVEDGEQITKGGLGAAVAGGIVGGLAPKLIGRSTGAIVGATIAKRKTTNSCTSLDVIITLHDPSTHDIIENILLHLISSPISKQSVDYMQAKLSGQKIIDFLAKITKEESVEEPRQNTVQKPASSASEIMEYKHGGPPDIVIAGNPQTKLFQLFGLRFWQHNFRQLQFFCQIPVIELLMLQEAPDGDEVLARIQIAEAQLSDGSHCPFLHAVKQIDQIAVKVVVNLERVDGGLSQKHTP